MPFAIGRLALLLLTAASACTSVDERRVQLCRNQGIADGTPAMRDCVRRLAAQAEAAQPPAIPPTFGGKVGCYPSRGVTC